MKILHVINSLATGGAEKLVLDSIPNFMAKGIGSDLLLLDGSDHPFLDELRQTPNLAIHSLGKGCVYNPFHVFKISRLLTQYDLIHVHLFPSLYWVVMAKIISLSETTLLFTEHNITNKRRDHFILKRIDKIIYNKYKIIITISQEVDSRLKKYLNIQSTRFVLIQNGVDIEKIKATQSANRDKFVSSKDEKIIIQVSSFTAQKDQKTLIKALTRIEAPIKLLLVGTGKLIEDCKELVSSLKLENRVLFLGIRMDVYALLKMADVVVLSSHYEGLSLSSIEGLASGRPFVASRVPGLTEVVDGAGILFPVGNSKALATKLVELFDNPGYYRATVTRCQERAAQYSIDKMIEKHLILYHQLWKSQN
jgi:glycosyltransferase involved in cell wall biosynthesis